LTIRKGRLWWSEITKKFIKKLGCCFIQDGWGGAIKLGLLMVGVVGDSVDDIRILVGDASFPRSMSRVDLKWGSK